MSKEEYPYQKYPPFCQGAFYLFQLHTAKKFCQLFEMELQRNFVWMEDVFFTGALHTYHYAHREGVMHLFDQNWRFCLIFLAKWDGLDLPRCQKPPKIFFDSQGGQGGQ